MSAPRQYRLALFAPHPVQYHAGIYRELAKIDDVDTTVFYEDRIGLEPVYVDEFKTTVQWDVDLMSGYKSVFLRNLSRHPQGGFLARINPGAVSVIRKDRFDALMLRSYCRMTDGFVFATARVRGVPIIFSGEATLASGTGKSSVRSLFKDRFLSRFLGHCDVVLYSCGGNQEYFRHHGVADEKMVPFPCAVDNDFFQKERQRYAGRAVAIRGELGISPDDFVIVFAARMLPLKRANDLVEAVSRIENRDIVLLFVGDGPAKEGAAALCRERGVRSVFTGFVNQGQISKYYAIGNLFAMLSECDRSPKAMNEAMNFAMPVICTTVTGTAQDLVKPEVNGFLVQAGDVSAIAEKIDVLNRNREKAIEMGRRSMDIVKDWSFAADARGIRRALGMVCGEWREGELLAT